MTCRYCGSSSHTHLYCYGTKAQGFVDTKAIERKVMADRHRPCLFGVAGPCQHPKCLDAHFETLFIEAQ